MSNRRTGLRLFHSPVVIGTDVRLLILVKWSFVCRGGEGTVETGKVFLSRSVTPLGTREVEGIGARFTVIPKRLYVCYKLSHAFWFHIGIIPVVLALAVVEPELSFDGTQFDLTVPEDTTTSIAQKRQTVVDWYIETAREELPNRSEEYCQKLGLSDIEIGVRTLRRRWGEYEDGQVSLHWRLILAPRKIQDYVVAHELAHVNHADHSDAFWNTVGTLVPDYRERREWLRVNGAALTV